jgi:hypothetical protein
MTRQRALLAALTLAYLLAPSPAYAWLGWLEELSGAGPWFLVSVDGRLKCFGAPRDQVELALQMINTAAYATQLAARSSRVGDNAMNEVNKAVDEANERATALIGTYKYLLLPKGAQPRAVGNTNYDAEALRAVVTEAAAAKAAVDRACTQGNCDPWTTASNEWSAAIGGIQDFVDRPVRPQRSGEALLAGGAGVRFSACKEKDNDYRIVSIDLGGRMAYTRDHDSGEQFADGKSIWMFSVVPTVSWRPLFQLLGPHSNMDWIDVGVGGGPYVIHSSGFDDFTGIVFESNVEFHVPPKWVRANRKLMWIPTIRYTRVGFLDGFDQNAFGPNLVGEKAAAIHAPDWVNSITAFVEVKILR